MFKESTFGLYSQTSEVSHQSYNIPTDNFLVKYIEETIGPHVKNYFYKPLQEMSITRIFMKHYVKDSYNQLKIHTDNAYLTVSLCIMGESEGSEVQFKNNTVKLDKCPKVTHEEEFFTVKPRTGWVYVHFGRHPHQVTPFISGERANYILWYTDNTHKEE